MRAFTLAVLAVAALLLTAGCAGNNAADPEPAAAPATVAAAPTYDQPTLSACKAVESITSGAPAGDSADDSVEAGRKARRSAELSDVDALRELAAKHSGAPLGSVTDDAQALAAAYSIAAWCVSHQLG